MDRSFIDRYKVISEKIDEKKLCIGQNRNEYLQFLIFAKAYFEILRIERPVVVEIGILHNCQKAYYEELLNAEHIGIDVGVWQGCPRPAEIIGDSHNQETVEKLKARLNGRPIDLLFIDGDHSYKSIVTDYALYEPLTRHLIALHDISTDQWTDKVPVAVKRFWNEINGRERIYTMLTFCNYNDSKTFEGHQMGIGLIIKAKI